MSFSPAEAQTIDTELADLLIRHRRAMAEHGEAIRAAVRYRDTGRSEEASDRWFAKADEHMATARALQPRLEELNAIFEQHRWSRFFLVNNTGGHIHSTMGCSTCHPTTEFSWLPSVSGLTERDAVAEFGAILCTICFPEAPVAWTNKYELEAAAKKSAQCPGSGTVYDRARPHRTGFVYGNWGTCPECNGRPTLTSTGKLRAHKPA